MSSTDNTNDTNTIDDKRILQSKISNEYVSKITSFLSSIIYIIIHIIIYFSFSGIILYLCKLAQSNILPTEINCFPYTNNEINITSIKSNIFNTWTDPPLSMKIEFPYNEYNKSNKIIDIFREYKEKSNSNFLANYFIAIIESIFHLNYSAINTIFNMFNEFSEIVLILFGPILIFFILFFLFLFNHLYIIYSWFSNMYWFLKTNSNDTNIGKPKWDDVTFTSPLNFCFGLGLIFLFIILFFIGFPLLSFIIFILFSWCILSCLSYKSLYNSKDINVGTIIKEVIKYYKIPIVSLISLFIITYAFSKLGNIQGIFSIITLLLIYFGFLKFDLFKSINEENLTSLVSYKQAKKTCSFKNNNIKKSSSLLGSLLGIQSGGNITNHLKKINKMSS
jgi:hypothetical protein